MINKNILITGGTRGLGLEYGMYLSKKGYNIGLTDISENASAGVAIVIE